jgi:phosphatidylglycerophosphatase A
MSLEISSLNDLTDEQVAETFGVLKNLIQDAHPSVDVRRGVFHDLVLYLNSVLTTTVRENIKKVQQSQSILQIEQNPEIATDEVVDQVLSNYGVTRDAGGQATGFILFNLTTNLKTRFLASTLYTANGATFGLIRDFFVVGTEEEVLGDDYRVAEQAEDGSFSVLLPAYALSPGTSGNIQAGASIATSVILDNVLSIYAGSDFVGGRDADTNADYLQKVKSGMSAKTIGGKNSYAAFLRAQPGFSDVAHVSITGAGDPEQTRDQHSIIPISGGGKVDVYVQTKQTVQRNVHNVDATYVGESVGGTLWQINISRDLAPGYYYFDGVAPSGLADPFSNLYEITSDFRITNVFGLDFRPDVANYTESAYSRYQAGYIIFEDTDTQSTNLELNTTTRKYQLVSVSMPNIREVTEIFTDDNNRPRATDILVRAAVPCFTRIAISINAGGSDILTTAQIAEAKQAIVTTIAGVGFSGALHATKIAKALSPYLNSAQDIEQINMFGKIRKPSGMIGYASATDVLRIPNDPAGGVTKNTTVFLTTVDDIDIGFTAK